MIWLIPGLKAALLALVAIASGRWCEDLPLLFPLVLFLGLAYTYRSFEWMRSRSQGEPIPWVRLRWYSLREGLNGLIVLFVSLLAVGIITMIISGGTLMLLFSILLAFFGDSFTLAFAEGLGRHTGYVISDSLFRLIFPGWFAIATVLYRYESWAQQRRSGRKSKTTTPPRRPSPVKPAPVDSVDLELDHLRGSSGLTRMKARQSRPPKP